MGIIEKLGITPGPWSKTKDLYDPDVCVYDSKGNWLANVGGGEILSDSRDPISHANARLIAVTPDMLEALIEIREWFDENHLKHMTGDPIFLYRAIEKACYPLKWEEIKELLK